MGDTSRHDRTIFHAVVSTALHLARIDAVVDVLLASGACHVADLGCGRGELLLRLREHDQFTRLTGIDIDARALAEARDRLGLNLYKPDDRLHVCLGSFEESDWAEHKIDAAVLLETIEHINPGRLTRVEKAVFGRLCPSWVIVTTPNQEYNVLHGLSKWQRRHPGHCFEWTRAQFETWCGGVAERQGYDVQIRLLGPPDPVLGSSTQMACFRRR